ncbi:MAG: PaaI family thioesterase, partial [Cyanobacteria bacterium]|nr:PaaI family thioesterase [Cyanobacteriota bacterium]
ARFSSGSSSASDSKQLAPELAQAILDRVKLIPIFEGIGVSIVSFSPGECVATVPRKKELDGIFESFHGGLLMTVADTIACFAIMTLTGPQETLTTTDMNIRFLAPCLSAVTAEAKVIKLGKTLCPVHVDLKDDQGKLVAVAQVTYIRLPQMPKRDT